MKKRLLHCASAALAGLALAVLLLWMGAEIPARADPGTRYVAPGGNCGAASPCHATVQAAVDAASAGDVIKVAQGTYTDVHVRDGITLVVYVDKSVTIRGGFTTANWGTDDPENRPTTLDAQGLGRVMVISGTIAPMIDGLRITGGDGTGLGGTPWFDVGGGVYVCEATATLLGNLVYGNTAPYGGGMGLVRSAATLVSNAIYNNTSTSGGAGLYLFQSPATLNRNTASGNTGAGWGGGLLLESSSATLESNTITGNTTTQYGGGVSVFWSDATLNRNTVTGNHAFRGGGLQVYHSDASLNGNLVINNTASQWGGGLWMEGKASTLVNNVVADNQVAQLGSGIYIRRSSPLLLHTTIARNHGGDGTGILVAKDDYGDSAVALTNTILAGHSVGISVTAGNTATLNATLWHANSDSNWSGNVNHTDDYTGNPAFAPDGYHLLVASPAIDKGVNAGVRIDIDGHVRPADGGYDLGADEYARPIYLPLILR
jgi:hypothetical protein